MRPRPLGLPGDHSVLSAHLHRVGLQDLGCHHDRHDLGALAAHHDHLYPVYCKLAEWTASFLS